MIKHGLYGKYIFARTIRAKTKQQRQSHEIFMERSAKTNRVDVLENIERQIATRAHVLFASNLFPSQVLA